VELPAVSGAQVTKTPFLDLVTLGLEEFEKLEGLAVVDGQTLAILNDNDFGLERPQDSVLTLIRRP